MIAIVTEPGKKRWEMADTKLERIESIGKSWLHTKTRGIWEGDRSVYVYQGLRSAPLKELHDAIEIGGELAARYRLALERIKTIEAQLESLTGTTEMVQASFDPNPRSYWAEDKIDHKVRDLFGDVTIMRNQLDPLAKAVNTAIKREYNRGFHDGSSALTRLARGDMSVLDFETDVKKREGE